MDNVSLSPRQQQILILVAQGLANKEIARRLRLSRYTIGEYLSITYGKLGVSNRAGAAQRARELGLIKFNTFAVN